MLDKLDEIIKRFVAVFLFPLVNMLIMILITYFATSTNTNGVSSKISLSVTSILHSSAEFIRTNFTAISSALHDFQSTFQTITSASAAASLFIFVLTIYLIDRVFYYVGFYCPPNFEFDLNSYGAKVGEGRKAALKSIFKTECEVAKCYGAIKAYLGQKNSDQNRINQRNKFLSSIETAKTVLAYTKAYILYLVFVFASAAYNEVASWIGAGFVLITLFAVGGESFGTFLSSIGSL